MLLYFPYTLHTRLFKSHLCFTGFRATPKGAILINVLKIIAVEENVY